MTEATTSIPQSTALASSSHRAGWIPAMQIAVLGLLLLLVYRLPLETAVHKWLSDGNWSHGWLVPVFSVYFLIVHRSEIRFSRGFANYLGVPVMLGALGMLYVFYLFGYGYPQQFSVIPCLIGVVLLVGGWGLLRVAWFPVLYLLFALPLPYRLYFSVTFPMRRIASEVAGTALGFLPNVYTQVQGVVIDYAYGNNRPGALNVEEACSGMRLLMAFCALGVAMAYLGDRPMWQRVIMVVCCIPIAVLCNTIRVFTTGVIHIHGYDDWAQGTPHELLGLAMLPIALGLFALVSYVLKNLFVEVEDSDDGAVAE